MEEKNEQIRFPLTETEKERLLGDFADPGWRIGRMHKVFGKDSDHKCGDCRHFWKKYMTAQSLHPHYRCALYGDGTCKYADWEEEWDACGRFLEISAISNRRQIGNSEKEQNGNSL